MSNEVMNSIKGKNHMRIKICAQLENETILYYVFICGRIMKKCRYEFICVSRLPSNNIVFVKIYDTQLICLNSNNNNQLGIMQKSNP